MERLSAVAKERVMEVLKGEVSILRLWVVE